MIIKTKKCHYPHSLLLALLLTGSGCEQGEGDIDLGLAVGAGIDAIKAITLSDENVKSIAMDAARVADNKNQLAPADSPYTRRLQGLARQFVSAANYPEDLKFDFHSDSESLNCPHQLTDCRAEKINFSDYF